MTMVNSGLKGLMIYHSLVQSLTAVTAYLESKRLLVFDLPWRYCPVRDDNRLSRQERRKYIMRAIIKEKDTMLI